MKKIIALAAGALITAGAVAFIYLVPARAAETPSCTMNIKAGWNLVSFGEFLCGMMEIDSRPNSEKIASFPAYVDVYAYDGREYVYGRVRKQDIQNHGGSFEKSIESYFNNRVKNLTNGQYSRIEDYFNDLESSFSANNIQKMREAAGRLARESFVSVWVYNPGREFTITRSPEGSSDDEGILLVLSIKLLSGNISESEYALLRSSLEEFSDDALREIERQPGMLAFVRELFSGRVPLESGWNFLSYSKVLSDNAGRINLSSGNCNVTKAYVFDDSAKNWVRLGDASAAMVGSGVVVYNAGGACALNVKNQYLDFVMNLIGGGAQTVPPPLPN